MIDLSEFEAQLEKDNANINMMNINREDIDKRMKNMYNDKYIPIRETFKEIDRITRANNNICNGIIFNIPKTDYAVKTGSSGGYLELAIYLCKDNEEPDGCNNFIKWITLYNTYTDCAKKEYYNGEDRAIFRTQVINELIDKWGEIESGVVESWKKAMRTRMDNALKEAKGNLDGVCNQYNVSYEKFH